MRYPLFLAFVALMLGMTPHRAWGQDVISLMLDEPIAVHHAGIIVAQQRGAFVDANLSITILEPDQPFRSEQQVLAQRVNMGITTQPRLHLAVANGEPLSRIGTLMPLPRAALMVLADSPVTDLLSLDTLSVVAVDGTVASLLLGAMATQAKGTVTPISVRSIASSDLTSFLVGGSVDAIFASIGGAASSELMQRGVRVRVFPVQDHGIPFYDERVFFTRKSLADSCRTARVWQVFMKVLSSVMIGMLSDPIAAWNDFRQYESRLDTSTNRVAFYETLSFLAINPMALDRGRYRDFQRFLARHNPDKGRLNFEDASSIAPTMRDCSG